MKRGEHRLACNCRSLLRDRTPVVLDPVPGALTSARPAATFPLPLVSKG